MTETVSQRADDREGCLDAVFATADRSLSYIKQVESAAPTNGASS